MRIYIYNENCDPESGQVCTDEDTQQSNDCHLWGEGEPSDLALQARERLALVRDTRAGGAGDAYAHRCARNALAYVRDWL